MDAKPIAIIGGGVAVAFLILSRGKGINLLSPTQAQQLQAQRQRMLAAQNTTAGQAAQIATAGASIFSSLFKAFSSPSTSDAAVPVASVDPTQPIYGVGSDATVGGQLTPPPIDAVAAPTDSTMNDLLSSYQPSDPTLAAPDTSYPDAGFSASDPSFLTDSSFNSDPLAGLGYA